MRHLASARAADSAQEKRWFKGNLHMHTQWSDGQPLPEWAIDWYKAHGYDFIGVIREGTPDERADLQLTADAIRDQYARVTAYEEQVCGG